MNRAQFLKTLGLAAAACSVRSFASPPAEGAPPETVSSPPAESPKPSLGEYELNTQFIYRGPGLGRRIALTFDDGPNPGVTDRVLEELKKRSLQATFFMIGRRVVACPDLARQVKAEGHEIANHSFTHPKLSALPPEKVAWELESCQGAVEEITGITPIWFRPPYGAFRKNQGFMAVEKKLGVAYWTVDPRDWARPGIKKITQTILTQTKPGCIVLMHDLHRQTAEAVGGVLDGLLEKGFEFTSLSGFLEKPYA
jgi:peptidoglycan/xylan/chitin deacetylase (PgdA/CDA1 family)